MEILSVKKIIEKVRKKKDNNMAANLSQLEFSNNKCHNYEKWEKIKINWKIHWTRILYDYTKIHIMLKIIKILCE